MSTIVPLDCSSESSGDYYGLGVRLGIYCIWLTSWLANSYCSDEITGALDANAMFLLALIVALVKGSVRTDTQLKYIDGLILMHLCSGYIFGCFSTWGYRTIKHVRGGGGGQALAAFGGFGTHFRLLLCAVISVYGSWFWNYGVLYGLSPLEDEEGNKRDECYPLRTFFFGRLDVYASGGIRYYYIVVTVACAAYYCTMLAVAVGQSIGMLGRNKGTGIHMLMPGKGAYVTGLNDQELRYVFNFCSWGNLVWMLFALIMVELTIVWNHATAVTDGATLSQPSQLLPFLVGALGLVRIIYIIAIDTFTERAEEEENAEEAAVASHGTLQNETTTTTAPTSLPLLEKVSSVTSTTIARPSSAATTTAPASPVRMRPELRRAETASRILERSASVRYLVAWLPWLSLSLGRGRDDSRA